MASTRCLRWAGSAISNSRHRFTHGPTSARSYSSYQSHGLTRQSRRGPVAFEFQSLRTHQHSRSLSLFGWGNTSKVSDEDVLVTEPSPSNSTSPSSSAFSDVASRTVKASHETSETIDPSQFQSHAPNSFEPEFLEKLQQSIVEPAASDTGKLSFEDISKVPERIGYLKEVCGLDHGWGPTAFVEWYLEHIHIDLGLGWPASIAVMAITIRLALIYPMIRSGIQTGRMKAIKPMLDPLREQYREAAAAGDRAKASSLSAEMRLLSKEADIKLTRAFLPLLMQIPLAIGAFRILRNCASLPVPGFVTANWLWTSDLTFSDPYFLTPALSAAFTYFQITSNGKANMTSLSPAFTQMMATVFPAVAFCLMVFQPGAVQIYFLVTAFGAFLTSKAMTNASFRESFGMPKLGDPTAPGGPTGAPAPSGGLRRRVDTTSSSTDVTPTPDSGKRSYIDQRVDGLKKGWSDFKANADKAIEDTMGKASVKVDQKKKERLDEHEYKRRQELRELREERNSAAKDQGWEEVGGLRRKK